MTTFEKLLLGYVAWAFAAWLLIELSLRAFQ
jgi:hypothetical protein